MESLSWGEISLQKPLNNWGLRNIGLAVKLGTLCPMFVTVEVNRSYDELLPFLSKKEPGLLGEKADSRAGLGKVPSTELECKEVLGILG